MSGIKKSGISGPGAVEPSTLAHGLQKYQNQDKSADRAGRGRSHRVSLTFQVVILPR